MIHEVVAMEAIATEAELTVLATGVMGGTAPKLGAAAAPEVVVETHVDAHPGTSTEVVMREPEVQEAALIRSAPMSEATLTSRGGLELLDDNLVDPIVVAHNMESMRHAK
jgi:hypothetical protein